MWFVENFSLASFSKQHDTYHRFKSGAKGNRNFFHFPYVKARRKKWLTVLEPNLKKCIGIKKKISIPFESGETGFVATSGRYCFGAHRQIGVTNVTYHSMKNNQIKLVEKSRGPTRNVLTNISAMNTLASKRGP